MDTHLKKVTTFGRHKKAALMITHHLFLLFQIFIKDRSLPQRSKNSGIEFALEENTFNTFNDMVSPINTEQKGLLRK